MVYSSKIRGEKVMEESIYEIYLRIKAKGWKCPHCKKRFKEPIKTMTDWGLLGHAYAFFMFCPYCKKDLFSNGSMVKENCLS